MRQVFLKRLLMVMSVVLILSCAVCYAESNVWEVAERYLSVAMDTTKIEHIESNAPAYSDKELEFWFDFRDGWRCVMVMHDQRIRIKYAGGSMDDQTLINGFYNILELLPRIQAGVPKDVDVSLVVAFADGRICEIAALGK